MAVLSLPCPPNLFCHYSGPNPKLSSSPACIVLYEFHTSRRLLKIGALAAGNSHRVAQPCAPGGDFFRQLAVSSVFFLGLGISSLCAYSPSALAHISPPASSVAKLQEHEENHDSDSMEKAEITNNIEDDDMRVAFEQWKSKTYALTVPLRVVALQGSVPPLWLKEFFQTQGKRARLRSDFRRSMHDIFHELSVPLNKGKFNPKSAIMADLVSLGESWLPFAIQRGLIEPIKGAEDQDWFQGLSDKWKVYLRRSSEGKLDSQGRIWAVPYRWGSMVIAYNKRKFQKHGLTPIKDWEDLWRPELAGKIAMVDSPRDVIGTVLKCMGASYNANSIDSEVVGGKQAVLQKLTLLAQQVRLFDSLHYLKAFGAGDVWVAVGSSSDVLPAAKRMSNIAVVVPKSGTSLWVDFWAIPAASKLATDQIGGRVRGPSPLIHQWIEFCLQPARALPFEKEVIPGASPIALEAPINIPQERSKGRPKLDTNLIANVPPPEILSRCEFLEPLSDEAFSDYKWLFDNLPEPSHNFLQRVQHYISSVMPTFRPKIQSKLA